MAIGNTAVAVKPGPVGRVVVQRQYVTEKSCNSDETRKLFEKCTELYEDVVRLYDEAVKVFRADLENCYTKFVVQGKDSGEKQMALSKNPSAEKAMAICVHLRIEFLEFPSFSPAPTTLIIDELELIRNTLEHYALLSIMTDKMQLFSSAVTQLCQYYFDYNSIMPKSSNSMYINGLYLLWLTITERNGDCSTYYELIPDEDKPTPVIDFCKKLEAYLIDGNYAKYINEVSFCFQKDYEPSKNNTASDLGIFFFNDKHSAYFLPFYKTMILLLSDKIKDIIADCLVMSYDSIPVANAQRLLMLPNKNDFMEFVDNRNVVASAEGPKWKLKNSNIVFEKEEQTQSKDKFVPDDILHEMLELAANFN